MNKDFLHISDFSSDELLDLMKLAKDLKQKFRNREDYKVFHNKTLAMIFAKPSARTRISFETGFEWMGGHALFLGPNDIGIGKREAIKDIGRLLSRYNDLIMARLFDHNHILELSSSANIPVINGLTDYNHPCQIMSDFFTIWENKGSLEDLKICYMGDGNNIVNSWLQLTQKFPINFVCACPAGYEPDKSTLDMSIDAGLSKITITNDPFDSIQNSDVIYTDVWASMGQKDEAEIREKVFKPFQVNKSIMSEAGKNAVFMHCLPAERDREVTDEVMEAEYSIVFEQAENRLHIQNAIMATLLNQTIV
ncbi:MAG: ornithine carbamoyltransferase [Candidatus Marinimicrobia bacterium]|nr:ornithine carbamoyltransferase [Candidatus Neomarinimicrobiota bacterium]MBS00722.1 ornithine carbamoyltransferase [Candidatus Neomarinimicrobiota bacterium]MEC7934881.1 ornithine carbamoyltransferase [Candidatus Neomarinimicrobiota bacterium]MEC9027212.1 ornithine carbamoyltransferase [Candidatus Neomarinimicrobiota bacterium]MEC9105869.1 ornithine carbamoyltransferase [Candidatus Neomarinimicrobiota bacterium]|tara:strand:+ start:818 stop:1741 length:924 start_codon:yes stop_codon:yes gene_type:complete